MKPSRHIRYTSPFIFLLLLFTFSYAKSSHDADSGPGASPEAKIFVDPDVRVTYDGDVPHMEAYIGASATDPDFLFAGGELAIPGRALTATEARLYVSNTAGALWTPVPLANEVNGG